MRNSQRLWQTHPNIVQLSTHCQSRSADKRRNKAAEREVREAQEALRKGKPKKPDGGGGDGGDPDGDRGSGRGAPKNNKPDNNDMNAAQLAEISEFLDAELKTSGMTLHEHQQTFNTFQNGNPAVDDPSLWVHRFGIDEERSKAYQIKFNRSLHAYARSEVRGTIAEEARARFQPSR